MPGEIFELSKWHFSSVLHIVVTPHDTTQLLTAVFQFFFYLMTLAIGFKRKKFL